MKTPTTVPTPLIPTAAARWELYNVTVGSVTADQVAQVCAKVLEEVLRSVFDDLLAGSVSPGDACQAVCERWERAIAVRLMEELGLCEGFGVLDTEPRTLVYRMSTRVFAQQPTIR